LIIHGQGDSDANIMNAWHDLGKNLAASGVTALSGTPGVGHVLIHECLVRNTPDWFMTYIMSRTPLVVLIGTQLDKSASGTRFKHVPMGRCGYGLRLSSNHRMMGSDPLV
jgi:hypothetical protein